MKIISIRIIITVIYEITTRILINQIFFSNQIFLNLSRRNSATYNHKKQSQNPIKTQNYQPNQMQNEFPLPSYLQQSTTITFSSFVYLTNSNKHKVKCVVFQNGVFQNAIKTNKVLTAEVAISFFLNSLC